MGSQACEAMFRSARSCSPNQSTVVNFNISEFLGRLKRIQLCNDIPVELDGIFKFPRTTNLRTNEKLPDDVLPNNNEIDETIKEALHTALEELKATGMKVTEKDCCECSCKPVPKSRKCSEYSQPVSDLTEDELVELTSIQNNFQYYDFEQDLSTECTEEYKRGPYVKIYNKNQKIIQEIKKTTLCWYLNEDIRKPSQDRTRRFIPQKDSRKDYNPNQNQEKMKLVRNTFKKSISHTHITKFF